MKAPIVIPIATPMMASKRDAKGAFAVFLATVVRPEVLAPRVVGELPEPWVTVRICPFSVTVTTTGLLPPTVGWFGLVGATTTGGVEVSTLAAHLRFEQLPDSYRAQAG
jgi:hypothetical protein